METYMIVIIFLIFAVVFIGGIIIILRMYFKKVDKEETILKVNKEISKEADKVIISMEETQISPRAQLKDQMNTEFNDLTQEILHQLRGLETQITQINQTFDYWINRHHEHPNIQQIFSKLLPNQFALNSFLPIFKNISNEARTQSTLASVCIFDHIERYSEICADIESQFNDIMTHLKPVMTEIDDGINQLKKIDDNFLIPTQF